MCVCVCVPRACDEENGEYEEDVCVCVCVCVSVYLAACDEENGEHEEEEAKQVVELVQPGSINKYSKVSGPIHLLYTYTIENTRKPKR